MVQEVAEQEAPLTHHVPDVYQVAVQGPPVQVQVEQAVEVQVAQERAGPVQIPQAGDHQQTVQESKRQELYKGRLFTKAAFFLFLSFRL
jgi:hypothetical protein